MRRYIGTKLVLSRPMTRLEYNGYRGWELPANENGADEGYLVEYVDGGKANHPDHEGYISWSPKEQHENAYMEASGLTFGLAIEAARKGLRIAREGWNGKGMWVCLMPALHLPNQSVNGRTLKFIGDADLDCQPYFAMWTAAEQWQPGWLASQADMLATDWVILD